MSPAVHIDFIFSEQSQISFMHQGCRLNRPPGADLIALDEALDELEKIDERACRVVELRYFGGLSEKEAAEILDISVATLKRDWTFARTWLYGRLR